MKLNYFHYPISVERGGGGEAGRNSVGRGGSSEEQQRCVYKAENANVNKEQTQKFILFGKKCKHYHRFNLRPFMIIDNYY